MARYAIVMTTSSWDDFIARQVRRTQDATRSGDVYVLADATGGPVAMPPAARRDIVTARDVEALGLPLLYERTLFCYNLDYFYIHFHRRHPGYDHYVFLDAASCLDIDMDAVIARVAEDAADLVAEPIAEPLERWVYTQRHRALYGPGVLAGVALAIVILSRPAIAHLARRRLALAEAMAHMAFTWPFCEAFVPTELATAGFRVAPLSRYGAVDRYRWWPPTLEDDVPFGPGLGFVHPVADRARFPASLLAHTPTHRLFERETRRQLGAMGASASAYAVAAELLRRGRRRVIGSRQDTTLRSIPPVSRQRS